MGTLADMAAGTTTAGATAKEYKTRTEKKKGGSSLVGQLKNLYTGIAHLPVDLAKQGLGAPARFIRLGQGIVSGDLEQIGENLSDPLSQEAVKSVGRTGYDVGYYTPRALIQPNWRREERAGESILLQALAPSLARESARGNLLGKVVEDVGNVTLVAGGIGAIAGRVGGGAAAVASADAASAGLAADVAAGGLRTAEMSAAAARGAARAQRGSGLAGRLATTNPELAAQVQRIGHVASRVSELGNRLDPIGGPLAAAKGILPSTTLSPFDRIRGAAGEAVRTYTPSLAPLADIALPDVETVRFRKGLETGVGRESSGAVQTATRATRAAETAMKAAAADQQVPITEATTRDVLRQARGKAPAKRTADSILDARPEGIPETLPTDVGTARRVAVMEAEGKWDSMVASYADAVSKGVGEQWLEAFDRRWASEPDTTRVYGHDIKALADYRKGAGIFEGVDGGLRRTYIDEFANTFRTEVEPVRTEAELRGEGRTNATVLGETQTARRRPTASRSVEGVMQDVEFGVTEEAIAAERAVKAKEFAERQRRINKETPAAIRNTKISDVQAAVADELAARVAEDLASPEEMRRRGAAAQRAATEEQTARAKARKAQTVVEKGERKQAKLEEKAKTAALESAEAQAKVEALKPPKKVKAPDLADVLGRHDVAAWRLGNVPEADIRAAVEAVAAHKGKGRIPKDVIARVNAAIGADRPFDTWEGARERAQRLLGAEKKTPKLPKREIPAAPKLDETTRGIINRKIGEGPPTPKMEAAAQRLAARRLAGAAETARKAAETAEKPLAAARKRGAAALERAQITEGRGKTAKAYAQATDAERAADAAVHGRVDKNGKVTMTMTRRVFEAAGRKAERATSAQRRVARMGRDQAKTAHEYQFVEEELSRSAQDLAKQTGDAAMKTMKGRVGAAAGALGEVREHVVKGKFDEKGNPVMRLELTGELGNVAREVDQFYGPAGIAFNDAATANLVNKADELQAPLSAREKMSVYVETLNEQGIRITDEQMTRLQHSTDVADALERADDIIAGRDVNGTWLGSPQVVAQALEEISWLPDDIRTKLRNDTSVFLERQVASIWKQKQLGAIPGFARSSGIVGRQGVESMIELARDANNNVPGSGDVFYQMALDIATNLEQMTEQGMKPVHVTGGAPPKIPTSPDAIVSQKALKSQFQKKTATAPLTPEELQMVEADQAIQRVRNVGYRKARAEVSNVPENMPGFNQFAEQWKADRGISTMTDPQWGEAVDAWNTGVAKNKKQRLKIIEPDQLDEIEFEQATKALDVAKRRHAEAVRAEKVGGVKLDYAIDEATKKLDAAQARFDTAEVQMRPRVITHAIDDALTKWRNATTDIPPLLKPIARFNTWMKTWVLGLSPKWQLNQILGNPVMAMMYGGMSPSDMLAGPGYIRNATRPFNGDMQAFLEAGGLDAHLTDMAYNLGVDVPAGTPNVGIRGVENVESGITTSERRATKSVREGGERAEPVTPLGQRLRDNKITQTKAALSEVGLNMGAKRDAFWRSVVTLQNVEKFTEKFLRYDADSGFTKLRDKPLQMTDLSVADLDRITATAHNEMLKWMGDFSKMQPWERRIMRHIVPFWSWIRHSNLAFARLHVYHPRRVVWMAHMGQLMQDPSLTDQERGIISGMLPISEGSYFDLGNILSPVSDDATESLINPVFTGPSITQAVSPAINIMVAATTGISMGRGSQATRPGGVSNYFQPLLANPRDLAGYVVNKTLPGQFRALRDVVQGPGPRYDTGQKKESGTFRGATGGRLGALAKTLGIPTPENIDLEKARG